MDKEKLKTIKDMKEEADELSFGGYTITILQREAEKWVEHIGILRDKLDINLRDFPHDLRSYDKQIEWIKEFFNLEDDGLKDRIITKERSSGQYNKKR